VQNPEFIPVPPKTKQKSKTICEPEKEKLRKKGTKKGEKIINKSKCMKTSN
jgi:hypothetical protein